MRISALRLSRGCKALILSFRYHSFHLLGFLQTFNARASVTAVRTYDTESQLRGGTLLAFEDWRS
jgi:hypothetical protein